MTCGQTTPVAYTRSKFVALPALTPRPLIGHAKGVVAGVTCFDDRNPHNYVGTAAGLTQGVDEELLLQDFGQDLALRAHCVHIAHAEARILTQEYL